MRIDLIVTVEHSSVIFEISRTPHRELRTCLHALTLKMLLEWVSNPDPFIDRSVLPW